MHPHTTIRHVHAPAHGVMSLGTWLGWLLVAGIVALAMTIVNPVRASELPDGRGYELVSPARKNANEAGVSHFSSHPNYATATADGGAILYGATGPLDVGVSGVGFYYVGRRAAAGGWVSSPVLPRGSDPQTVTKDAPSFLVPSADLSHAVFTAAGAFTASNPNTLFNTSSSIYRSAGAEALEWVGQPAIANPEPPLGEVESGGLKIAGISTEANPVYFTYYGTLVASDASREPNLQLPLASGPWGFYEWKSGHLANAGELPPGSAQGAFDPFGAIPAAVGGVGQTVVPEDVQNEVSPDGSRAFFVSPDPNSSHPGTDPVELYVREDGEKTVLISRSEIGGGPAPTGVEGMPQVAPQAGTAGVSYVYASPDGSHALFVSRDQLTSSAPSNDQPKAYMVTLGQGGLTYLPGVTDENEGTIAVLAASTDGTKFMFEKLNGARKATGLEIWDGTQSKQISALSERPTSIGRATSDGRIMAFVTNAAVEGGFNNTGGFEQVYRYEVETGALNCVSCPPSGITPTGDAHLTNDDSQEQQLLVGSRGMSTDGGRVFFDSPDSLVSQDVNGRRDVYEWENGSNHLISSGVGTEDSSFLDNSDSGDDVFFTTAASLVGSDTDEGFDVYDARVGAATGGASAPPECVSSCQGPLSPPPLIGMPASESLTGQGNLAVALSPRHTSVAKKHATSNKRKSRKRKRRAGKTVHPRRAKGRK